MKPDFLLFAQARLGSPTPADGSPEIEFDGGWWHFQLESADGQQRLSAGDYEPHVGGERLELLAVVRGLEALDQPSRVALVTPSRYVHRGLRFGLSPWRENQWRWECFGELAPVKNSDLWQRVDRALDFHRLECRLWRADGSHQRDDSGSERSVVPRPHFGPRDRSSSAKRGDRVAQWLTRAQRAMEQLIASPLGHGGENWAACG